MANTNSRLITAGFSDSITIMGGDAEPLSPLSGGDINIKSGSAPAGGMGGTVSIISGSGADGGGVVMASGDANAGDGGYMSITGGTATAAGSVGGDIDIAGGIGAQQGGSVVMAGGTGTTVDGGGMALRGGTGAINGGEVRLIGGTGSTNLGGTVFIQVGAGTTTDGTITLVGTASATAELRFAGIGLSANNAVGLRAPAVIGADITFTLPEFDGVAGTALITDGAGGLTFGTPTASPSYQIIDADLDTFISVDNNPGIDTDSIQMHLGAGSGNFSQVDVMQLSENGVFINSSNGSNNNDGAPMVVTLGSGNGNGNGGYFELYGGGGGASGNGGGLDFFGGDGTSGGTFGMSGGSGTVGSGGNLSLTGGTGVTTGGNVSIQAGYGTSSGGDVILIGGGSTSSTLGKIKIANTSATNTGILAFLELPSNGTNLVGFKAPSTILADVVWTLPDADGVAGQTIITDGTGGLTFGSPPAGNKISDADGDTYVDVEETPDNDHVVMYLGDNTGTYFTTTPALDFSMNELIIQAPHGDTTSGLDANGIGIRIDAGNSIGSSVGGAVKINGGAGISSLSGGVVSIFAGDGGGSGGEGGQTTISGGFSNNGNGGTTIVSGGQSNSTGNGGNLILNGGFSGTSFGGDVHLSGGNGSGGTQNGDVKIVDNGGVTTKLQFTEVGGVNDVGFRAPNVVSTSVTWTLPSQDASSSSGQALTSNGAGQLQWTPVAPITEYLTVTAINTIPNLGVNALRILSVVTDIAGSVVPAWGGTVAPHYKHNPNTNNVVWNPATSGLVLKPGDRVHVMYVSF